MSQAKEKEIWTTNDLLFELMQLFQEQNEKVDRLSELMERMSDHLRNLVSAANMLAYK